MNEAKVQELKAKLDEVTERKNVLLEKMSDAVASGLKLHASYSRERGFNTCVLIYTGIFFVVFCTEANSWGAFSMGFCFAVGLYLYRRAGKNIAELQEGLKAMSTDFARDGLEVFEDMYRHAIKHEEEGKAE